MNFNFYLLGISIPAFICHCESKPKQSSEYLSAKYPIAFKAANEYLLKMNFISILIGILLGSLLLAATSQWLLIAKKGFKDYQKQVFFLDRSLTALQYFLSDIHAAGYRGRRSAEVGLPLFKQYSEWNPMVKYFSFDKVVFGFIAKPGVCYGKMPDTACKRVKANSAVLILYNVAQKINPLLTSMKVTNETLSLPSQHGIHKGALLLIEDIYQGDLFITNRINDNLIAHEAILGLNRSENLSKTYVKGAEVVELQTVAYYLGIPERVQKKQAMLPGKVSYALFRDDFLQNAQEIIAEVEEIQFEYGLQNAEQKEICYKKAENIRSEEWASVKSLRISLFFENSKNWSFEIALRNRICPYFNLGLVSPYFWPWNTLGKTKFVFVSKDKTFFS